MKQSLIDRIISILAPDGCENRDAVEAQYPVRTLLENAEVTRMCPSPTGFVHIGSIYTALVNDFIAHQSGGVMILRVEDTDKKREVPGALDLIIKQFRAFEINVDEGPDNGGNYGPYLQSERGTIYLTYALELLRNGRAYPCFATSEELEENVRKQQASKLRPGYYGEWAIWRDKSDDEIEQALGENRPFVLRFRSSGSHDKRVSFHDELKGDLEFPENDLDIPLLKSDEYRLPTYHLAHVVDDHLMKPTIIIRGEEWLPSTPLHFDMCDALNLPRFRYAHLGVISILDDGKKRKLSKRKDPEADVQFFLDAGYPVPAIKAYLLNLANSNFEDWRKQNPQTPLTEFKLSLQKLAMSRNPLLDIKKLDDISRDYIGDIPQPDYEQSIKNWAKEHDPKFAAALEQDPDYTSAVLAIEREGDMKRKDLIKWSDAPEQYSYFFDSLVAFHEGGEYSELMQAFLETYSPNDGREAWFEKVKDVAERLGYARDMKDYKANQSNYKGSVADVAMAIRVALTGRTKTPDLWTIMNVMGPERVQARLAS